MEYFLLKEEMKRKMEEELIMSITTKSWKLYHNPIFSHHPPPKRCFYCTATQIRTIQRRFLAFRDLGFNMAKSSTTELENARTQIIELKAELELDQKMRKKLESVAKKMAKELAEERRKAAMAEHLCDELQARVSNHKLEIDRIQREMDEERRMLRVAEVIREERLQMKLEDAKLFYEERFKQADQEKLINVVGESACKRERKRWVSEPPENPHIKRGIKGFVEFPRGLVKPMGSNKSNRNYKIECQKAQFRILLKQKNLVHPTTLPI